MEKRGGTRRTGRRHEEGGEDDNRGQGRQKREREKKREREVTREADENGPFSRKYLTQKVQHGKCELKHKIKLDFLKHKQKKNTNNEKELN